MVEERYSPFQLIQDRNKSNAGSQGFSLLSAAWCVRTPQLHDTCKAERRAVCVDRESERESLVMSEMARLSSYHLTQAETDHVECHEYQKVNGIYS